MHMQSEKNGLNRAHEDACTMLLGTLMLHVVTSLRRHRHQLDVMLDPEAECPADPAATFVSAAADVITVLPHNQSSCSFWEALLALDATQLSASSASQTYTLVPFFVSYCGFRIPFFEQDSTVPNFVQTMVRIHV